MEGGLERYIYIVMEEGHGPESQFIEVDDGYGRGIGIDAVGEWVFNYRETGNVALRIRDPRDLEGDLERALRRIRVLEREEEAERDRLRERTAEAEQAAGALVAATQLWLEETAGDYHPFDDEPSGRAMAGCVLANYEEPLLARWTDAHDERLEILRDEAKRKLEEINRRKRPTDKEE